jgi:hypothetical protein
MISWKQWNPLCSKPWIIDVFPVPGAPVTTTLFLPKHFNLRLQSNEISQWKKNWAVSHIFVKKRMEKENTDEFYARLKDQLLETTSWPSNYLFKFIVPTDEKRIEEINAIFDNTGAVIESKKSKKGTYTSVSITVNMKDPDEVIAKYKEVSTVEGIISL